jgi:hypothetical protein
MYSEEEQILQDEMTKCKRLEKEVKQVQHYFAILWDENFTLRNRLQKAESFIGMNDLKPKYCAELELGK